MRDFYQDRAIEEAKFLLANSCTIREVATFFDVSKSTVHKDLSLKLKDYDYALYESVKKTLEHNLAVRHLRGGESTKRLYKSKQQEKNLE